MGNKVKEDERIEGIIRGLLKLPENRRCINCNSLGPQYVCTTFLTFVCTNCSGVHREFTHRVKSISMAKFTADEVSALQAAGNERARQIYLNGWDPQRNSYPDGSNLHRIRDFIKHVYVDRKYTGEKSDKLPRLRLGEKEESFESRKVGTYLGESRSPRYESRYEPSSSKRSGRRGRSDDINSRYYFDESRSPQYNLESSRFSGRRKNPVHFEIVDDRFRDDVSGGGRLSDSRSFTNRVYKSGSRSPDCQRNTNSSSSAVVRPIRDILGENAPLEVGKHSKAMDGKDADASANNQKIAASGSQHSVDENPVEDKKAHPESLINVSTDSEPTNAAAAEAPQTELITPPNDGGNQISHEPPAKEQTPEAPPPNSLELLLLELSPLVVQSSNDAPSTVYGSDMPAGGALPISVNTSTAASAANMQVQPNGRNMPEASVSPTAHLEQILMLPGCVDTSIAAPTTKNPVQPSSPLGQMTTSPNSIGDSRTLSTAIVPVSSFHGGSPEATPDISSESAVKVPAVQQLNCLQQHQPLASSAGQQKTTTQENNQLWALTLSSNQGPSSAFDEQSSQTVFRPDQDIGSRVGSEPIPAEANSSGRKELPADLFTASYLPVHAQVPHWHASSAHAMGYQNYPNTMLWPAYSNPAKSTNPFDFNSETTPMQVPQFPSMASLQGGVSNPSFMSTSNFALHSPGSMMPQSPSYGSGMHPQSPSLSLAMPSSPFMGQQIHMNMNPTRLQGIGSFGSDRSTFGNTPQQPTGGYPVPSATDSYSAVGGNPFG